jgi:hypothetical protein
MEAVDSPSLSPYCYGMAVHVIAKSVGGEISEAELDLAYQNLMTTGAAICAAEAGGLVDVEERDSMMDLNMNHRFEDVRRILASHSAVMTPISIEPVGAVDHRRFGIEIEMAVPRAAIDSEVRESAKYSGTTAEMLKWFAAYIAEGTRLDIKSDVAQATAVHWKVTLDESIRYPDDDMLDAQGLQQYKQLLSKHGKHSAIASTNHAQRHCVHQLCTAPLRSPPLLLCSLQASSTSR